MNQEENERKIKEILDENPILKDAFSILHSYFSTKNDQENITGIKTLDKEMLDHLTTAEKILIVLYSLNENLIKEIIDMYVDFVTRYLSKLSDIFNEAVFYLNSTYEKISTELSEGIINIDNDDQIYSLVKLIHLKPLGKRINTELWFYSFYLMKQTSGDSFNQVNFFEQLKKLVFKSNKMNSIRSFMFETIQRLHSADLVPEKENWNGFLFLLAEHCRYEAEKSGWTYEEGYEWGSKKYLFRNKAIKPIQLRSSYYKKHPSKKSRK
ncbi:MAG: hypothetical protein ACFFFT_18030 [Candidatus Thorarchaeota archaeon]